VALTKIGKEGITGISNSSDATAITISSGELVGIGETSPTSALHVKGGAGANVAIQSTAGSHWRLGDGVGASNGQFVLYDYTNSGGRVLVNAGGEVNLPAQPAFAVKPSGDQSNVASGAVIVFDSEIYDVGSNFASNTFTAPVTGKYQISVRAYVQNIDRDSSYVQVNLTTSNRGYFILFDPDFGQDPVYWTISFSELVDMDANDTAVVNWYQGSGSNQADINSSSFFSGFLAC
jgi:hypothetical protein